MATLIVPADSDFFGQTLNNISFIQFTNAAAAATATFLNTQFNNVAILDNVLIDGSAQDNHISAFGGSVSALSWTFANWTDGVDTISLRGGDGDDVIIGSVKSDQFHASFGSDSLFGGLGNDTFTFFSSAGVPGEIIDGGDGLDTIVANNFADFEAVSDWRALKCLGLPTAFITLVRSYI